jgi:hypothetical protein
MLKPLVRALKTPDYAGCGKKLSTEWMNIYLLAFSIGDSTYQQHTTITTKTKSPQLHTPHSTQTRNHIAIMGNGAKAASKRERNAKDAGNVAKSQLKSVRFFS